MSKHSASWAGVGVLLLACAAHAQVTPTVNDLTYAVAPLDAGGTITLHMDLYLPADPSGPAPIMVFVHGGGWQGGTYQNVPPHTSAFLAQGVAVASVQYRLSQQAIFPAQIHDVKGAIRFLRANAAQYNLNPARIGVWGASAGGHLAAHSGTSSGVAEAEGATGGNLAFAGPVQAVVDHFGPTDLLHMQLDVTTPPGSAFNHDDPSSPESKLIGFAGPGQGIGVLRANQNNPDPPFPEKIALITLADPIMHVTPDDPPFLIVHGTADNIVPLAQSTKLRNALAPAGVPVTCVEVVGAGHGGFPQSVQLQSLQFMLSHLLAPPPSLPADLDGDCDVDSTDLNLLLSDFGCAGAGCTGDIDGDGDADSTDLNVLLASFGQTCS